MKGEDRVGLALSIAWLVLVFWLLTCNHVTMVRILVGATIVLVLIGVCTANRQCGPPTIGTPHGHRPLLSRGHSNESKNPLNRSLEEA